MLRNILFPVFALLLLTACDDGLTGQARGKEITPDIDATVEARLAEERPKDSTVAVAKDITPDVDATVEARLAEERPKDSTVPVAPVTNVNDPYSIVQESTVKISYSTAGGEYTGSGVIVGDGHFIVTNAHVVYGALGDVEVAHYQEVGPRVVTDGSIIYIDEYVDLALIHVTDSLGPPVNVSFGTPKLGEDLVIGGFPAIGGETLTATRGSVAGFQSDGLIIKFDGEIGHGNSGGPALNKKGQLVGIVTSVASEASAGNLGMMLSTRAFYYGLAEELLKYNETSSATGTIYGLKTIGIPAHVTKPPRWSLVAGLNYFHIASPDATVSPLGQLTDDYEAVGMFVANSFPGESPEAIINRLVTEFGESFQRISEPAIPTSLGFDECGLLKTVNEFSETPFTRRGYVYPGAWFSHSGLYSAFCVVISNGQKFIAFAESPDIYDIVHENGLLSKISSPR